MLTLTLLARRAAWWEVRRWSEAAEMSEAGPLRADRKLGKVHIRRSFTSPLP